MHRHAPLSSVLFLGWFAACGPKEPAEGPTANPVPEPLVESQNVEPRPEPDASAPPSASVAEPTPAPALSEPALRELCEKVCTQVAAKCSASVAENCRINCDQYDRIAPACQKVAREALTCSEGANDLPCANVAPESCGKQFQRMAACQRAPESFAEKVEEQKSGPSGWVSFEPSEGGFVALMPPGPAKTTGDELGWQVSEKGVRYFVRKLPPPQEKFTPKSQVRLAMEWLAPCNLKLKLHGQVEKDDRTSVHYDIGCKGGSERHGMIFITPSALFIIGTDAPAGERGELDAFVYGFKAK